MPVHDSQAALRSSRWRLVKISSVVGTGNVADSAGSRHAKSQQHWQLSWPYSVSTTGSSFPNMVRWKTAGLGSNKFIRSHRGPETVLRNKKRRRDLSLACSGGTGDAPEILVIPRMDLCNIGGVFVLCFLFPALHAYQSLAALHFAFSQDIGNMELNGPL